MGLGAVTATSMAAPSAAQAGHPDPNFLHLTPDQQKKMNVRQVKMKADWDALVKDKTMTDQQKQAKAESLQKSYEADMMAMLTPEQRDKVDKQKADAMKRKAFADARMKQIVDIQTKLLKSLNPAQHKKLDDIRAADYKVFQSIEGDKTLSDGAKNTKLHALNKDENVKINAILTAAQRVDFQKLQDLIPAPPGGPAH